MTVFLNPSLALVQLPFKSVNDRQYVRDENPTRGQLASERVIGRLLGFPRS